MAAPVAEPWPDGIDSVLDFGGWWVVHYTDGTNATLHAGGTATDELAAAAACDRSAQAHRAVAWVLARQATGRVALPSLSWRAPEPEREPEAAVAPDGSTVVPAEALTEREPLPYPEPAARPEGRKRAALPARQSRAETPGKPKRPGPASHTVPYVPTPTAELTEEQRRLICPDCHHAVRLHRDGLCTVVADFRACGCTSAPRGDGQ